MLTADPANPTFSVQTGEVRSKGVELSGVASLTEGLSLVASYSYLDNEVTKASALDGTEGKRLLGVPEHLASLWANYEFHGGQAERVRHRWRHPICRFVLRRSRQ